MVVLVMEKIKSRKLWITVLAGALVAFGEQFGIDLDPEQLIAIAGMVLAYVGSQAVVDRGKVVAEVKASVPELMTTLQGVMNELNASGIHEAD